MTISYSKSYSRRAGLRLSLDPTDETDTTWWIQPSVQGSPMTPAVGDLRLFPHFFDSPTTLDALGVSVATLEAESTYTPVVYGFVDDDHVLELQASGSAIDTSDTGFFYSTITAQTFEGLVFIGGLKLGGVADLDLGSWSGSVGRYLPNYGTADAPAALDDTLAGFLLASQASVPSTIDLRAVTYVLDAVPALVWGRVSV